MVRHLPFPTLSGALHLSVSVTAFLKIWLTPLAHTEPPGTESAEKSMLVLDKQRLKKVVNKKMMQEHSIFKVAL